jgi:uncharacterized membrane protein YeaQ/YmgE (transglycosylase-associated protein family)
VTLVWILLAALCGGIGCAIAQAKNRKGYEGFVIGAVLGVVGIVIVLCLPRLSRERPAGWYADPAGVAGVERFWDGCQWSDLPTRVAAKP